MLYLSVIISAYNESASIKAGALDELFNYLNHQKFSWELIIVNDGSDDDTSQSLHRFSQGKPGIQIIDNPHMGKAAGVITGALQAQGEIILFTDMDQATPISEFDKFLAQLKNGAQIVIGSRADRKGAPLFRQVLAYGQIFMRFLILRLPYRDTQCGFKAFTKAAARQIFMFMKSLHPLTPITGPAVNPGFDLELLYLGRKMGFKIVEVPVAWHYKKSKRVNFVNGLVSGVKELLIVRLRSFQNVYKV